MPSGRLRFIGAVIALSVMPAGSSTFLSAARPARPGAVGGQALPQGTTASGVITGRVVDNADGRPIADALVELAAAELGAPAAANTQRQTTDGRGRFAFLRLPSGSYYLRVSVGGNGYSPSGLFYSGLGNPIGPYVEGGFGQRRPGGGLQMIALGEGQKMGGVTIPLWRAASISGMVLDQLNEPVAQAVVGAALLSSDGQLLNGPTIRTDDRGRYRIGGLLPGRYVVFVANAQTVTPMTAVDGLRQRIAAANPAQPPAGLAQWKSQVAGVEIAGALVSADATGLFASAPPVRVIGNAVYVYPTLFFPSVTTLAAATPVNVNAGEDRLDVDFSEVPVPAASISGVVTGAAGPMDLLTVHLAPAGGPSRDASLFETAVSYTDTRGAFTIPVVPAGDYELTVRNPPLQPASNGRPAPAYPGGPGAWLTESLTIGPEGVKGLFLSLHPGLRIDGQVDFAGGAAPPTAGALRGVRVSLVEARPQRRTADVPSGLIGGAGPFEIVGFSPGRYILRPTPTIGAWRLRSVVVNGRDVTEQAFDIAGDLNGVIVTYGEARAMLTGRVAGATTEELNGMSVAIFPADRAQWADARALSRRVRLSRVAGAGDFIFADLPDGDYLAIAVDDAAMAFWPDASLLSRLSPDATPVHVAAQQPTSVTLNPKRIR